MSGMAPNLASLLRLMLVTDDALLAGRDLVEVARSAERGGVTAVQLRLKQATARELMRLDPTFTVSKFLERSPSAAFDIGQVCARALRGAGIPE